jgi:thioredoxin reductase
MTGLPVVIIGAGPYGLSVAAHLRARGVDFRIFGRTMSFWQEQMPEGMLLKSDGFASSLSDPDNKFTLADYCEEQRLPYADTGIPVRLDTFVAYGRAFQKRIVPEVEERLVVSVDRTDSGSFLVQLSDGELVSAQKLVIAAGIGYFPYTPPVFSELAQDVLTHSSAHSRLAEFKGRQVCVFGGGASAVDTAALLHEAGAEVQIIAREIHFHDAPPSKDRPVWVKIRAPYSGIGGGWRQTLFANAPALFSALPEQTRIRVVRNANGPAGGWAMKDRVLGQFPILQGFVPQAARMDHGRVRMRIANRAGETREIIADHVISATGYHNDLSRLSFLNPTLMAQIRSAERTPVLSMGFESSVPGLYFVGPIAKIQFGPLLRFVYGAGFASRQTARHIASSSLRRLVRGYAAVGTRRSAAPEAPQVGR